jgi:very-short-patch-repair endonuclease
MAQLNRDARLRAAGYQVVHFTWAEITRVPGQVAATVGAAFRQSVMMRNPGRTMRPD